MCFLTFQWPWLDHQNLISCRVDENLLYLSIKTLSKSGRNVLGYPANKRAKTLLLWRKFPRDGHSSDWIWKSNPLQDLNRNASEPKEHSWRCFQGSRILSVIGNRSLSSSHPDTFNIWFHSFIFLRQCVQWIFYILCSSTQVTIVGCVAPNEIINCIHKDKLLKIKTFLLNEKSVTVLSYVVPKRHFIA